MTISSAQLSELVDQHWGALIAWVGPLGGVADDVVQDAFIKLAAADPTPDKPVAWLFTVTHRLAINERQRKSRRLDHESQWARCHQVTMSDQQNGTVPGSESDELRQHLDRLDESLRRVLVAKIWGELNLDEIAALMGCSRASVHRMYQKAIINLQYFYGEN